MTEILLNQLSVTLPIHFCAYVPLRNHLRRSKVQTLLLLAVTELLWLFLISLCIRTGASVSLMRLTSLPLFCIVFLFSVDLEHGKLLFLYAFHVAYCLALQGAAVMLNLLLPGAGGIQPYSMRGSIITLTLFFVTLPLMLWYFRKTLPFILGDPEQRPLSCLSGVQSDLMQNPTKYLSAKQNVFIQNPEQYLSAAPDTPMPDIWKTVWLLPMIFTGLVLLFTYPLQTDSGINLNFMLARIFLLVCMFLICYFVLSFIQQFKRQIAAEEHIRYLKQLTDLQAAQYALLKSRIEETRRTRHDLRQNLRAMQGYIDRGDLNALTAYLQLYGDSIPNDSLHDYCQNYAVNSVLGFYAELAGKAEIEMKISLCPMSDTIIPEPEFCVLLGNLLENALEACIAGKSSDHTDRDSDCISKMTPVISVRAGKSGNNMLFLTVDNTCPCPPFMQDGHYLSSKHEGTGIGISSVRTIAEKYHGDARFEWKNGIFYASVMLNA